MLDSLRAIEAAYRAGKRPKGLADVVTLARSRVLRRVRGPLSDCRPTLDVAQTPFTGLVATPTSGGTIFEVTTLIAMAVYALLVWGIVSVIPIVMDRPHARTTTRATVEQTPGGPGNERTTRTTRIG